MRTHRSRNRSLIGGALRHRRVNYKGGKLFPYGTHPQIEIVEVVIVSEVTLAVADFAQRTSEAKRTSARMQQLIIATP